MSSDDTSDIDLTLIADSFRTVSDVGAWDNLIASWDRKIAAAGLGENRLAGEAHIKEQYKVLANLLERVGLPTARDPLEDAVGSVPEPAMALSQKLRVVAINAAGRAAFRVEQGQFADLSWLDHDQHASFRQYAAAPYGGRNGQYSIIRTQWQDGRSGYAELFPVALPGTSGHFLVVRELTIAWTRDMENVLVEAFGLTNAEVDTARILFSYVDVAKIADARGVNIRTARLQLSSVFGKTNTATQADLVRLLVLLAARISAKGGNTQLHWSDPLGNERLIVRPDGRRLAYTWMGDPDGRPALFVPGVVNGYLYPPEFENTLRAKGVKLYVMSRPGAGKSDADRTKDAFADFTESILHLCTSLDLRGIPAAGIHAGVIPLTAVAARPDTPFSAVVGIGRFLHYTPKRLAKIAMVPRTLLWLSINAPWAAEIVGRHGWRAIVQNGVDWYIERAYRDMPFDFETTKRPEIAALMRNACTYTFLQSHEVFFDDMRLRATDIREHLRSLSVPFRWLVGTVDVYGTSGPGSSFYEPADFEEVRALNSRITVEPVSEGGELLPYQQPALVADRIAAAAYA